MSEMESEREGLGSAKGAPVCAGGEHTVAASIALTVHLAFDGRVCVGWDCGIESNRGCGGTLRLTSVLIQGRLRYEFL